MYFIIFFKHKMITYQTCFYIIAIKTLRPIVNNNWIYNKPKIKYTARLNNIMERIFQESLHK